jgi:Transposase DDE domain
VRWGSLSVYGVKLHLPCSTNRVPLAYELTASNVAEVRLTKELLEGANLGEDIARRLFGALAYRSEALEKALTGSWVLLVTERSRQNGKRQQIEIVLASLIRVFRLGESLATTLVGLVTRIAAKVAAYTNAFLINRMMARPQGRIKELWA